MSSDTSFKPGDQVSFYGGEGTIIQVDGPLLHIHTDNGKVVKHRSDLPMVSKIYNFDDGERVRFPGGEGVVIKTEQRPNQADLLYVHTEDGDLKTIPADKKGIEPLAGIADKLAASQFDAAARFDLLEQASKLDIAYRFDRFLSLSGSRIDVTPHQVEAAYEILNSHDQRYLLADEVGLGKTIEAGIVIEELMARGRAERVLIVTPASLKMQWAEEMKDKFDQDYVIYDRSYVDSIQRSTSGNVWEHDDRIITSIDFAKNKDLREALEKVEWDIAIFDEAHHLTARRDNDGKKSRTERYRLAEAVSPNTDALLFLTGTPHKGKRDQFYFMIDLLEPYRFENEHDVSPQKLDDLMIRRLKTNPNMVHSNGTPMFPKKEINTLSVEFTDEEDQLYQDITDYLRNDYRRGEDQESHVAGFSMVIYQKRLVSSIHAIRCSLEKRAKVLRQGGQKGQLSQAVRSLLERYQEQPETLTDYQRQRVEEELQEVAPNQDPEQQRKELEIVEGLIERTHSITIDSKAKKLHSSIKNLLNNHSDEKVLVFTEYTDTLEYLRDSVLSEFDVAEIHGGLSQSARRDQVEKFREEANIMLATDAAREGINLQFAHIMINYDLPWNPIRIDQRMGRLHRYGQDHKVSIYNLFIKDTRESKILEQLTTKIDRIEEDLGMSSDVLGMVLEDSNFDLEDRIMEAIRKEESSEEIVEHIDKIIEERKDAVEKIQENFLIKDQFGESDLEEIQEIIEKSRSDHVGQGEVQQLLELFFEEFGGDLTRRQSAPSGGEIFTVSTPNVIELIDDEVKSRYNRITFDQEVAKEDTSIDFLAVNHPLVKAIVEYCLDGDWIDGRTTVKCTIESPAEPGLLCNFRLGYEVADGSEEMEEFVPIYITTDGEFVDEIPEVEGSLAPDEAKEHSQVQQIIDHVDLLLEAAREEASLRLDRMVEEAEKEKQEVVEIKRQHAKRYFDSATDTWERRLQNYREGQRKGKEMSGNIGRAQSELRSINEQRKHEFERLQEEESVYPSTNELINVAVMI